MIEPIPISATALRPDPVRTGSREGPHDVAMSLTEVVASAEPAVVYSSVAQRSVPAFSDACTVEIIEDHRVGYRISYPHSGPEAPPQPTGGIRHTVPSDGASTGARTVRTRIEATDVAGFPDYAGIVVHSWREHHPNLIDMVIAQLLVDHADVTIQHQWLLELVRDAQDAAADPEADDDLAPPARYGRFLQ